MTEIDISKVLVEGDTATIMGVKYQRVGEPMSRFVKNPDEIVLEDVRMFHYETMEEGRHVWMGIYMPNGKIYHLNISVSQSGQLNVYYSNESVD